MENLADLKQQQQVESNKEEDAALYENVAKHLGQKKRFSPYLTLFQDVFKNKDFFLLYRTMCHLMSLRKQQKEASLD